MDRVKNDTILNKMNKEKELSKTKRWEAVYFAHVMRHTVRTCWLRNMRLFLARQLLLQVNYYLNAILEFTQNFPRNYSS